MREPIALAVGDLHLQLNPPPCRRGEPDWFKAMAQPLQELKRLQKDLNNIPILCAGDVFDKWDANKTPELINFAIDELPVMHAIPGQHDLPNHRHDQIERSAFWTLVQAKKLIVLSAERFLLDTRTYVYGIGWGEMDSLQPPHKDRSTHIVVIHGYIWNRPENAYPGAPNQASVAEWTKRLKGYDLAIFGDNHKGFECGMSKNGQRPRIWNCGTFMRRRSDEDGYQPRIGVVYNDGLVEAHELQTVLEWFQPVKAAEERAVDLKGFVEELKDLSNDPLDFEENLRRAIRKYSSDHVVRQVIEEALNGGA